MATNTISNITKKGIYLLCYQYFEERFEENLISFFKCEEKPSDDPRYHNMRDDWHKHRIANFDRNNEWFLNDSRLNLLNISGWEFLDFICFVLTSNEENWEIPSILLEINKKLRRDWYEIIKKGAKYIWSKFSSTQELLPCYRSTVFRENFKTPCIVLIPDYRNDYGAYNAFNVYFYSTPNNEGKMIGNHIWYLKILDTKHCQSIETVPESFTNLENNFFSLFQSKEYYKKINSIIPKKFNILKQLNDISYNRDLLNKIKDNYRYKKSLLRSPEAHTIMLEDPQNYSFSFTNIDDQNNPRSIQFDFYSNNILPYRINAIIGKNGCGKTTLLAKIADKLTSYENKGNNWYFNYRPNFSKVLTISYSVFDKFKIPDSSHFSYQYCWLRTKNNSIKTEQEQKEQLEKDIEAIENKQMIEIWKSLLAEISEEYIDINNVHSFLDKLSSWQKILVIVFSEVLAHIEENSLLLFDEPETHLHPNILFKLIKMLHQVLADYDSYIIIWTHSPIVIQQIPQQYVNIIHNDSWIRHVSHPTIETFWENFSTITKDIFWDYESRDIMYKDIFEWLKKNGKSKKEIEESFWLKLSLNAEVFLDNLFDDKTTN